VKAESANGNGNWKLKIEDWKLKIENRQLLLLGCWGLVCLALAPPAAAQSVWELTPYRIQVLVAFAPAPELTPRLQTELLADLAERADSLVGAAWIITVAPAPPALQPTLISAIESVPIESLPQQSPQADKVMLLAISPAVDGCRVTAREFDVPTQLFSAAVSRPVWQLGKLCDEALAAVFEAFAPLARIESVEKEQVTLRLKAAALPLRDRQLSLVQPGDVFLPVIRYQDGEGNLRKDRRGIVIRPKPVPWTFCTVRQITPSRLECQLHSGLRSPLSGRRRGRVQQLALAVVPPQQPTILTLQSRSEPKQALAGYEVYAHPPDAKTPVLLGRTDGQGRITVPPGDGPLRVLLARSGGELLARLPMVPGLQAACTAEIAADDPRLEAEGLLNGLREELVDLVARREVLFARTRARIKAGQFDEAEELIGQLLRLEQSQQELSRTLAAQQRGIRAGDPVVQREIDALFGDTQKLLRTQLHAEAVERLREELRTARSTAKS